MRLAYIYRILNLHTNKCYIGSTINLSERFRDHKSALEFNCHFNIKLQNSYNKHGKDAFTFEVIKECDESQRDFQEAFYIQMFNSIEEGYNISKINLETRSSEAIRRKMSKKALGRIAHNKGVPHTEEAKQRIRDAIKDRVRKPHSEETKQKCREGNLAYWATNPKPSHITPQEVRDRISLAQKGISKSEETKRKMSEAAKNRPKRSHSEATKAKMRHPHKREERVI